MLSTFGSDVGGGGGEQGGGGGGGVLPRLKKIYDPPLRFKMTPTPSEMAFDPL